MPPPVVLGLLLNGRPDAISWGWFQITVANFVVILLMIAVFAIAVLAPFPRGKR
jgi:hypothetical protein